MYSDGIKRYAEKNDIVDKVKEWNTPKLIYDLVSRWKYLVHYLFLQLGIQQGYRVTHIHHIIGSEQALFIFEYMNMLSEKGAKSKTTVDKNLYKLLANSTYVKFVETGLKRKWSLPPLGMNARQLFRKMGMIWLQEPPNIFLESDRYQIEYTCEKGSETILHRGCHSGYVQAHHLRFLLQHAQECIR